MGSNQEPEVGTRTSFQEPRVTSAPFFKVPSFPETNGSSVGQTSGVAFNPGAGIKRTSKRTPRKAPTHFHAAQPEQQQPVAPPLQEKQPSEPAQPQFFIFKAADEKPRRTPAIRKAKARTATTPFSAATAAAVANGFFASHADDQSPFNSNDTDGMAWSPSTTNTNRTPEPTAIPLQQQQQERHQKHQAPPQPPASFLFTSKTRFDAAGVSGAGSGGCVAQAFTNHLKLDEHQKPMNPSADVAAHSPPTAPYMFSAGSPQAAAAAVAVARTGLRPRRRGTPHRPSAPAPTSPPAFAFQAKPSQNTQQQGQQRQAAAATTTAAAPEVQQQPVEGFISLSQFKGTPGAPLRRRPHAKPHHHKQQQKKYPLGTSSPNPFTATASTAPIENLKWNAAAAFGGGTSSPPQQYQQHQPQKPFVSAEELAAQVASGTADTCRIAGNDSFRKKKYEEAFKQYTEALNTLMPYPTLHSQLSLLLSNRAAASLALGRPLQALQDCRMGLHHNKSFLKCALRMATCHCRLGEYSQAQAVLQQVRKDLQIFDASGLTELEAKEAEVKESIAMMVDTLSALGYEQIETEIAAINARVASSSASSAITSVAAEYLSSLPQAPHPTPKRASLEQALNHFQSHGSYYPHAEMFHAARSETLLRLGRFREALAAVGQAPHDDAPGSKANAPWRIWIRTQIAFYKGQATEVEKLLDCIEKLIISSDSAPSGGGGGGGGSCGLGSGTTMKPDVHPPPLENLDSIVSIPSIEELASIRTMLKKSEELRETGNKAVGAGKYQAAIEAYTEALSSGSLSPALAAILYCNRAAAHQGLGNIALAVADCFRAKALAPGYAKAHSRLATLLHELGMYSSVVDELNAAIQSQDITPTSRTEYQNRLRAAKEAAAPKRTFYGATIHPPSANHYKVLGVERGCAVDIVRKAYKKLALQLHPDKSTTACRVSFQISSNGSDLSVPAAETQKRLEEGASWIFKCLGEANETLSAPEKRRELDAELSAWEDASVGGNGRGGGSGGGGARSYYYSPGGHHQHSTYSSYGAYYRPHAQPSYNFNRQHQYGGSGGGASGSGFRHYW